MHAVTSSERAHSITWYKQKRRQNRWASKQVSRRYSRWQRYFKQKRCSLASQKVCFDWKQDSLFNMIYFLLEKSNSMCTTVCWLIKGVETGDSRIDRQIDFGQCWCVGNLDYCLLLDEFNTCLVIVFSSKECVPLLLLLLIFTKSLI